MSKTHKFEIAPSHVAILVPSVRKAADFLKPHGFQIGKEETWDGEGTKEIYVELGKANALLLMEPIKSGAYQRAMDKRGPGLHHLAVDVLSLNEFLQSIDGGEWSLHPASEKTVKEIGTAWLYRKGFPALIEVQERKKLGSGELCVSKITLPSSCGSAQLVAAIGLQDIVRFDGNDVKLKIGGVYFNPKQIFRS